MDDIYKNIEEYNPNKKRKISNVSDDMIPYMLSNKTLNPILTKLFIRESSIEVLLFLSHNLIALFQKILD